jgi:RHS repeat-associated protein
MPSTSTTCVSKENRPANNRLISMIDAVGTTTYSYTDFGALLSEDGPWADDTVSYTYTSNRLRSGMTLLQPNATAWSQTYTHDNANRLTGITSPAGTFSYTYDPVNNMLVRKLSLPNGAYITNGFDVLGRMTSTTLKSSSHAVLNSHAYVYDDASRRTRQTRTGGDYVDYGYDKIGQLKSALGLESGGTTNRWNERFHYAYDAAGNLSNRVQNLLTNVFSVDSLNQLTAIVRTNNSLTVAGTTTSGATNVTVADNGNSPVAATRYADATFARTNVTLLNGTNTFTAVAQDNLGRADTNTVTSYLPIAVTFLYDQNGNLRTNGTRIFEYDDENQLTRITEPNAWKSEFVYDGKMKMRVSKDYVWQGGAWVQTNEVRRVYDGMLVIQERDSLNLPRVTYTRGKDLSGSLSDAGGIGGLLGVSDHKSQILDHNYYHADGNGNVSTLADTNQIVVARYLYDPFGNTVSVTGRKAVLNNYGFSSKEANASSGLVYYGYRWYMPDLQRWLNRDPIEEKGGLYLYRFANNAPTEKFDPFGLFLGIGYGNWCGYSRSGPGDPIDDVDAACKEHDDCLATWGRVLNPFNFCRCHYQFCRSIRDADCSVSPDPGGCLAMAVAIIVVCPPLSQLF